MKRVVQITLKDGLMFPTSFIARAPYACVIFCRVPPDWLDGDQLRMEKLETVYEALYGKVWRAGNDDGSQYVVLRVEVRMLTAAEEQAAAWRGVGNSDAYQYWFYQVTTAGELQPVEAQEF
jgi:hypothetical protein